MNNTQNSNKLTVFALIIALLGTLAAWLVVPEFRQLIGLDLDSPISSIPQLSLSKNLQNIKKDSLNSESDLLKISDKDLNRHINTNISKISETEGLERNVNDFIFNLISCKSEKHTSKMVFELKIVNTEKDDRQLTIHRNNCLAIDNLGIDHSADYTVLGATVNNGNASNILPYNVPMQATVYFTGIKDNVLNFPLIRISFIYDKSYFNVEYRNIKFSK